MGINGIRDTLHKVVTECADPGWKLTARRLFQPSRSDRHANR